jgi:hypothetical protein
VVALYVRSAHRTTIARFPDEMNRPGGQSMKLMIGVLSGLLWATSLLAQNESIVNTRTDTTQREPRIARDAPGNIVVVWSSRDQAGIGSGNDICLQQFSAAGSRVGGETLVNQAVRGSQEQPGAAMNAAGDFVVVWASLTSPLDSAFDIKARLFRKGVPGPEFLVNTTVANSQSHPSVGMDSTGGFVVAWDSWYQDGGDRGVYARRFGPDGSPAGPEFRVNITTAYSQARPVVRMRSGGGFAVVWESWKQDGGVPEGTGVYGRLWNANGTPAGGEFQLNTTVNDYQWFADVEVLPDNSMAAVWCSWEQDGSDGTIVLQRLGPDGQKVGAEVIVNQTTEYYQWLPAEVRNGRREGGCGGDRQPDDRVLSMASADPPYPGRSSGSGLVQLEAGRRAGRSLYAPVRSGRETRLLRDPGKRNYCRVPMGTGLCPVRDRRDPCGMGFLGAGRQGL